MRKRIVASMAIILTVGAVAEAPAQQSAERFEMTVSLDYLLYLPAGYAPEGEPSPLVLFLHGAGERGDDLERVKAHGPPKLIAAGDDFPAIVVSPQAPEGDWWPQRTRDLLGLLDELVERYNVDEDRIYVTGLSMGGFGTWALLLADAGRFAAAMPICGGGDTVMAGYNRALLRTPVWAFHGDADGVVPLEASQVMVEAIRDAGGTQVELTVYPGVGHDSWTQTYADPEVWDWLFRQRR